MSRRGTSLSQERSKIYKPWAKKSRYVVEEESDDGLPETKAVQPVIKKLAEQIIQPVTQLKSTKPQQHAVNSTASPASNTNKILPLSSSDQMTNAKISSSKERNETKKTRTKARKPARSSSVSKQEVIIDSDWPFAHFGVLQLSLREKKQRKRSNKPRRHIPPTQCKLTGLGRLFNGLPAELRNTIYEYVIPQIRVLVCVSKPEKEKAEKEREWACHGLYVKMPRARLYCKIDRLQIEAGFETSAGLLLASKHFKAEVELFMYSRTVFCFESTKAIDMFLKSASKEGIKAIQSIEIEHQGYGEPRWTANIVQKERYDQKWMNTYQKINNEIISLSSLRLYMNLHDWPVMLNEREKWYRSLMQLTWNKPLDRVRVLFRHHSFSDDRLLSVQRKLEDRMMTEEGKLVRDKEETIAVLEALEAKKKAESEAEKARRATLPPQQATKVLKIRVEPYIVAPKKPVETTKTYTRTPWQWVQQYGYGNTLRATLTHSDGSPLYIDGGEWK